MNLGGSATRISMIYISKLFSPISTGTSAGDIDVGATVKINENGQAVEHIVVHQGLPGDMYDASCEGTWLLRKDIRENGQWNASNVNTLAGSTIMSTMAGFLTDYDANVQEAIKTVKIPYCVGNGSSAVNSGANGLECKIFPLSGYEVGFTTSVNQYFPVDGAKLAYFLSGNDSAAQQKRVATLNGSVTSWWIRSSYTGGADVVWYVSSSGSHSGWGASNSRGVRPAFILPYTFKFKEVS